MAHVSCTCKAGIKIWLGGKSKVNRCMAAIGVRLMLQMLQMLLYDSQAAHKRADMRASAGGRRRTSHRV